MGEAVSATLAIGLGCRSGVAVEAVLALVKTALSRTEGRPLALFTAAEKENEPALTAAAAVLGLPLVFVPRRDLEAAADRAVTRSERVVALFGVPSVAETAALAGAGPDGRLVLPRISADGVTCAIAATGGTT
nr:cobalamin biosynthesis protein [Chthonobacter albigriseus]